MLLSLISSCVLLFCLFFFLSYFSSHHYPSMVGPYCILQSLFILAYVTIIAIIPLQVEFDSWYCFLEVAVLVLLCSRISDPFIKVRRLICSGYIPFHLAVACLITVILKSPIRGCKISRLYLEPWGCICEIDYAWKRVGAWYVLNHDLTNTRILQSKLFPSELAGPGFISILLW